MCSVLRLLGNEKKSEEEMSSCLVKARNVFHLVNNNNFVAGGNNVIMDFFSWED